MNSNRSTPVQALAAILALVLAGIVAWMCFREFNHPSGTVAALPKTPAPLHEISSATQKNMENAESRRLEELKGLTVAKAPVMYARVVDQSGRPVSGAKVTVQSAIGAPSPADSMEKTSDSDGTLSFARKWPVLSITVTKPGYQNLLASSATFQYAKSAFTPPPSPDPSDPVVFVLQRM